MESKNVPIENLGGNQEKKRGQELKYCLNITFSKIIPNEKTKTGDEIPRSSSQFPFLVCFELISANPVLILFKLHCHKSKLWSSADCIANNSILKKLWFQ